MRKVALGAITIVLALLASGCRCSKDSAAIADAGAPTPESAVAPGKRSAEEERTSLLDDLHSCQFNHDGWILDFGTKGEAATRDFVVTPHDEFRAVERAGGTYSKVDSARVSYNFWIDAQQSGVLMRLKVFGGGARGVTAFIDETRVGAARIQPDEVQILRIGSSSMELGAGRHSLMLHFWGRSRDRRSLPFAELDWIQVGDGEVDTSGTYEAPTMESVLVDREIDHRPKRSVALMAPASARCIIRPQPESELQVSLAFWGNGRGTAEVRVVSEDEPPVTLRQQKLAGGNGATWTRLRLDLSPFASKVVGLELRALDASPGGRVLFGEPTLVRSDEHSVGVPHVDTVVIVVAAGLDRRRVPPYTAVGELAALGLLARTGATFDSYRVPTSVPAGVLASILTALPPELHRVQDQAARLSAESKTIAEIVKEAAGRTAFFTGVPTSFKAFGFHRGWDEYEEFSPVHDVPAAQPLLRAVRWLEKHIVERDQPKLLVVHARGAHPPWDVSRTAASELPPKDYSGPIDARRGGIVLGRIRSRRRERHRRIRTKDWKRVHALADAALAIQSKEIGRLLDVIEVAEAWDRTLFVFVGDVAVGDPPGLPYHPAGSPTEDRLLTPMIVRFPDGGFAGKSVSLPVTAIDIGSTVARALGVEFPKPRTGEDLYAAAAGLGRLKGRTLTASLGTEYATRLGPWLLRGKLGQKPSLCRLDVDPACTSDRFDAAFYVAPALWQHTHDRFAQAFETRADGRSREPASIDPETASSLTVWGDIQ